MKKKKEKAVRTADDHPDHKKSSSVEDVLLMTAQA